MSGDAVGGAPRPVSGKFNNPNVTANGEERASVAFAHLDTLWVNTGTLCNVTCKHCYIESSPENDRLAFLTTDELIPFLDEAKAMNAREIGFTGGEPFLNPAMNAMAREALARGFHVLILTNAMRPMMRPKVQQELLALDKQHRERLTLRVSLDHYTAAGHDEERGARSFDAAIEGIEWLSANGFHFTIAGRSLSGESAEQLRQGFAALFHEKKIALDVHDPAALVIFPEMDAVKDVPEITTSCWSILGKDPADMMCASSRMLVKRKSAPAPVLLSCTLLPYDSQFEMGASLREAATSVKLNHPFCAQFCVLGGASCSG